MQRWQISVAALFGVVLLTWSTVSAESYTLEREDAAQERTVVGTVFEDRNGNGLQDPSEPGIEGVLVSNQRDVVRTDHQGRFHLTVRPTQAVYVHQPSGYRVPLDALNRPRFSWVYEPEGSPRMLYRGSEPTGDPPPEGLLFPLQRTKSSRPPRGLVFGDPQPRDHRDLDFIRERALPTLSSARADFVLVLGDLVYDDLSLLPRYDRLMAEVGVPVWHLVGNHDLNYDAPEYEHTRATFRSRYGANYYSFEYGDAVFVALDNNRFEGLSEAGRPRYRGHIGREQLQWLENLLAELEPERLLVIATHIPLYAWDGELPYANTGDRDRLFELLRGRKVLALAGHLHMTYHQDLVEALGLEGFEAFPQLIATSLSGSWWLGPVGPEGVPIATQRDGTPNGFHLFTFEGDSYREKYRALGRSEEYQLRWEWPEPAWHEPSSERQGQAEGPYYQPLSELVEVPSEWAGQVIVNVFSGAPNYTVELSVNSGRPVTMRQVVGPSPFFTSLLARYPGAFGPSQALPTNHLWICDEPEELSLPGSHSVHITVRDGDTVVGQLIRTVEVKSN